MKTPYQHLIDLADAYAKHTNLTHWRVSFLVRGDGQFFRRLHEGKGCTVKTATRVMEWFDQNWAPDLEWPPAIPRPAPNKEAE